MTKKLCFFLARINLISNEHTMYNIVENRFMQKHPIICLLFLFVFSLLMSCVSLSNEWDHFQVNFQVRRAERETTERLLPPSSRRIRFIWKEIYILFQWFEEINIFLLYELYIYISQRVWPEIRTPLEFSRGPGNIQDPGIFQGAWKFPGP